MISIIIVNYNTGELLKECLRSIFSKVKKINFEILVIDNNSSDNSLEIAKKELSGVNLITNKNNLGFAGANNQGIKIANGKYIFLLNPDTVILNKSLNDIVKFMDNHPEIGACGPLVLNSDNSMQRQCKRGVPDFWNSFSYYSGLWNLFPKSRWWKNKFGGYFLLNKPDDKACEVDCLSGAAIIFRRNLIEKIGLLNEKYVMYWEDVEWCFRIKKNGWKVYYFPSFKILHYGGASGSQIHALKNLYYFHRGAYLFYKEYIAPNHFFLNNFLYYISIWSVFCYKCLLNLFKKEKIIGSKKPLKKK